MPTSWSSRGRFALLSGLALAIGVALAGCAASDDEQVDTAEGAARLPRQRELPDLMASSVDPQRRVESPIDFRTWRSDELRGLFERYVYGDAPPAPADVEVEPIAHAVIERGTVVYDEYAVRFDPARAHPIHLAIFAPVGVERPPVVLGPNKCGNQSIVADASVRVTSSFVLRDPIVRGDCGGAAASIRGAKASEWPVSAITQRGFALATFHESDAAPDEPSRVDQGIRGDFAAFGDRSTRWGAIATWSWATSRAVDALQKVGTVDPRRIAVFGHSRRGKAALWTAANDPRIALVIAHQSGRAGAAISRSNRGESLFAINSFFPHWFNDEFPRFNFDRDRLPIDQHELIALAAPRPVLIVDGASDDHADPRGARASVEAASPAWRLFGDPGLVRDGGDSYRRDATLVWTTRPGGHSVETSDWTIFLDFAERHLRPHR